MEFIFNIDLGDENPIEKKPIFKSKKKISDEEFYATKTGIEYHPSEVEEKKNLKKRKKSEKDDEEDVVVLKKRKLEGDKVEEVVQKRERKERSNLKTVEIKRVFFPDMAQEETSSESDDEGEVFLDDVADPETLFAGEAKWEGTGLSSKFVDHLVDRLGYEKPTKIQEKSIKRIVEGKDVLVKAQTGSGKTLVYSLPIIEHLSKNRFERDDGTYAIIITPTRELTLQVYEVLKKLVFSANWIVPGWLTGGEKKKSEKARLRKGVSILVATPGRLLDHLETTAAFKITNLSFLVLDEADRLLDMGFEKDIRRIINIIEERSEVYRQNLLLSATLNKDVNKLALLSLNEPLMIGLDESDQEFSITENSGYETHKLPEGLVQYYTEVPTKKRMICLAAFLRLKVLTEKNCKIIVFFSNCDTVSYFFSLFSNIQFPLKPRKHKTADVDSEAMLPCFLYKLHGNLSQIERRDTFKKFRKAKTSILFCTDVAARGLDLPNVSWIVQYDVPSDPASYIHRIGRTARMGKSGKALLFLMPSEMPYLDILRSKSMVFKEMPFDDIRTTLVTNFAVNRSKSVEFEEGKLYYEITKLVESGYHGMDLKSLAIKSFQSYLKSYATHTKETKHIFHVKNLHTGHMVKAFGLKDIPSNLTQILKKREPKKKRRRFAKHDFASEFEA